MDGADEFGVIASTRYKRQKNKEKNMVKFNLTNKDDIQILSFEIEGGILEPQEISSIKLPSVDYKKMIIISGRGPIWLYGFLIHELHPSVAVGVHDPRLGGVIIQSHSTKYKVGDVISL